MTRNQIFIVAGLVILNVIVFCGGGLFAMNAFGIIPRPRGTAVAREATLVPTRRSPTFVTSLPTPNATATLTPANTAVPTAIDETPGSHVSTIQSAMAKTGNAPVYRMETVMSLRGNLFELTGVADANQEMSMLGMRGEVNGEDSHVLLNGVVGVLFTGDPAKSMESIQVEGKSYIRGPLPLFGAKDER